MKPDGSNPALKEEVSFRRNVFSEVVQKALSQHHVAVFEPGAGRERAPSVRLRLPASHDAHAIARYHNLLMQCCFISNAEALKAIKQRDERSGLSLRAAPKPTRAASQAQLDYRLSASGHGPHDDRLRGLGAAQPGIPLPEETQRQAHATPGTPPVAVDTQVEPTDAHTTVAGEACSQRQWPATLTASTVVCTPAPRAPSRRFVSMSRPRSLCVGGDIAQILLALRPEHREVVLTVLIPSDVWRGLRHSDFSVHGGRGEARPSQRPACEGLGNTCTGRDSATRAHIFTHLSFALTVFSLSPPLRSRRSDVRFEALACRPCSTCAHPASPIAAPWRSKRPPLCAMIVVRRFFARHREGMRACSCRWMVGRRYATCQNNVIMVIAGTSSRRCGIYKSAIRASGCTALQRSSQFCSSYQQWASPPSGFGSFTACWRTSSFMSEAKVHLQLARRRCLDSLVPIRASIYMVALARGHPRARPRDRRWELSNASPAEH